MVTIFSGITLTMYLIIFLVGLINAINPRFLWNKFESWKATKEPSNTYFIVRRISGIIVMLLITAVALFPYIMSKQI